MSITSMGILRASANHIYISGKSRDHYWSSVHSTHPYSVSKGCMDSYLNVCIGCYDYLMAWLLSDQFEHDVDDHNMHT